MTSLRSTLRYRYVARLVPNPLDPGGNGGEAAKAEAPFVSDVGVGVEGDVGDGVAVSDEEFTLSEVPIHHPEDGVAQFPLGLQREPTFLGYLYVVGDPKPQRGDVGFVAVLLDVLSLFTETTPDVSNKPPNAPATSTSASAYMTTLRRTNL